MRLLRRLIEDAGIFLGDLLWVPLASNRSRFAAMLRSRRYGVTCFIDTAVIVSAPRRFRAGADSALYHGTYILNTRGMFQMGRRSHLGAYCYVNTLEGSVTLGDDVAVGPGTKIIAYSNHYAAGEKITSSRVREDITIGSNVFIGANCTILPGARIADHVVVGAGSVVKGTLETNSIYAGAPCRKVKDGWYGQI